MFSLYGEDFKRDRASVKLNAYAITPANDWPTTVGTNLQQAFRLSAVRFKSYIFVVSLVYGGDSRSLSYLVL